MFLKKFIDLKSTDSKLSGLTIGNKSRLHDVIRFETPRIK